MISPPHGRRHGGTGGADPHPAHDVPGDEALRAHLADPSLRTCRKGGKVPAAPNRPRALQRGVARRSGGPDGSNVLRRASRALTARVRLRIPRRPRLLGVRTDAEKYLLLAPSTSWSASPRWGPRSRLDNHGRWRRSVFGLRCPGNRDYSRYLEIQPDIRCRGALHQAAD